MQKVWLVHVMQVLDCVLLHIITFLVVQKRIPYKAENQTITSLFNRWETGGQERSDCFPNITKVVRPNS